MLSAIDLDKLIATKKQEIQKEKSILGLSCSHVVSKSEDTKENANNDTSQEKLKVENSVACDRDDSIEDKKERENKTLYELEEHIPPDLERYIRRYLGLPVMLKAGEYSPNNPLIRAERHTGDALLGLGEYERRRNTLRKIRQQQYREYLDEQAKKKKEAKEQAERERREREEKDRAREEKERLRLEIERENSPKRRASVNAIPKNVNCNKRAEVGAAEPLSVAVQTDSAELCRLSGCQLTEAERELSPRTARGPAPRASPWPAPPSPGDCDEECVKSNRAERAPGQHRTPSILDADAIQLRNAQAEKEAEARRQRYRLELKRQIQEQQRIKEERKNREKLLEQAELRRLEEQLRALRAAAAAKQNTDEYHRKITDLQNDIDIEKHNLFVARTRTDTKRNAVTSRSDPPTRSVCPADRKPYSTNIPANSIFSPDYDVDAYLRRNLNFNVNFSRGSPKEPTVDYGQAIREVAEFDTNRKSNRYNIDFASTSNKSKIDLNRIHHENARDPQEILIHKNTSYKKQTQHNKTDNGSSIDLPIPVLRHVPKSYDSNESNNNLSDAMKKVEAKWQVPVSQTNVLKSLSKGDGRNISILTQLGSIRRQLQLEQMKLDGMLNKEDAMNTFARKISNGN